MLIRSLPWTDQPQSPAELNPGLPSPALVWVGSQPTKSYVYPFSPSALDSTASIAPGIGGMGVKIQTATPSRYALTAAFPTDLFPTGLGNCTIAIVRRHTDTTARGATTFGTDLGATSRILLHAPFSDGNIYWDFGNATAGSGRGSGAYGAKTTDVECIVAVAGQVKGREVWRGKIGARASRLVQNTSAKATVPNLVSNPAFSLGSSASTVIADNEEQYLFVVSHAEWSDQQIQDFCANPWGFVFASRLQEIPLQVAAGSYTLTAATGSFTLSGVATGLIAARTLTADVGSFTLTGVDTGFARGYSLTADTSAFTLTGVAANLTAARTLAADVVAFTLTGQDAGLVYAPAGSYTLLADVGAFTLTGVAAGLTYTPLNAYTLTADVAAFALNGSATGLVYSGEPVPASAGHGFEMVGHKPNRRLWWMRKPKDLSEEEAEEALEEAAEAIVEAVAEQAVKKASPQQARKAVKKAVKPAVDAMPGFDWQAFYEAAAKAAAESKAKTQAAMKAHIVQALQDIERRRIEDEEDVAILAMLL